MQITATIYSRKELAQSPLILVLCKSVLELHKFQFQLKTVTLSISLISYYCLFIKIVSGCKLSVLNFSLTFHYNQQTVKYLKPFCLLE